MAREAAVLMEVEKVRARARQATLNNPQTLPPNSAEAKNKGETRDVVAGKVGFKSGHDAERAMKTVSKIDELRKKGDADSKEKAEVLQGVLDNRNPSAATSPLVYGGKLLPPKLEIRFATCESEIKAHGKQDRRLEPLLQT